MKDYVNLLKEKNLKITHHRLEILSYLDSHKTHPTAEEIYKHLKKKNPGLSRTTVYNNLDTLSESHIIQKLTICPTEHRYDFFDGMHHHFICKKCGDIYDVNYECPSASKIRKHVTEQGHVIDEVHGYFKGTCKTCIEKEKEE